METMETKVCPKCGRELELSNFKKTRWGSYSSTCTECTTAAMRATKLAQEEQRKKNEEEWKRHKEANKGRLGAFTSRELIEELARRGYEGKLTFTETHTIDITNF